MSELISKYLSSSEQLSTARNFSVFLCESLDSTMQEAKRIEERAKAGEKLLCYSLTGEAREYLRGENFVILAEEQNAGVGRENRVWISTKGKGLYLTFVLYPKNSRVRVEGLTQVASLAVVRSLAKLGLSARIKLPNDIVVLDREHKSVRKLAGILVDLKSRAETSHTIYLGLGLNLKKQDFPSSLSAITLEDVLEREVEYFKVFHLLCDELLEHLELFFELGFEHFEKYCAELILELGYE